MLSYDSELPGPVRRVAVAGTSGVGKTTLANDIAHAIGCGPAVELDALFHGPGWTRRTEFLTDVTALVARESFVTEWQYRAVQPIIADRCDLIVWLDFPFWTTTLPRVVRRTVRRRIHREILWNGNIEQPLRKILTDPDHIVRWSIKTRHRARDAVVDVAQRAPGLTIVRLLDAEQTRLWFAGPFSRAIQR